MEDPDAVKLNALKKAYAEVLLNVSKEAAARVMASEKRGLWLQQELASAKEEGFQLLLRLNQMFDAKRIETETVSISQQRRIEELETQLEEAEGIYTDLREELRKAQSALSKAATNKSEQPPNGTTSIDGAFRGETPSLQSRDFAFVRREEEEADIVEEEACVGSVTEVDPILSTSKSHKTEENLVEVKVMGASCNSFRSEAIGSFQTKRKRTTRYKKHDRPLCSDLWSSSNCVEPLLGSRPDYEPEVPRGSCEEMIKPGTSKMEMESNPLLIEYESVAKKDTVASSSASPSDMEIHRQIGGDKFRYTFQRRRKKKQLNCSDGNLSAEKMLKIETDERHGSQETENVDLTSSECESSRHSMQLVEVA